MIALILLGMLDILGGGMLILQNIFLHNNFACLMGIILLVKGVISYISAAVKGFYLDFMGILDAVCGLLLILLFFGIEFSFSTYIGIFLLFKGMYSSAVGLVKT